MKLSWRTELPQLAVLAAMFFLAGLLWSRAPDRVPVHWNAAGAVDRYGGKLEGLLGLPLLALGLYALLVLLPWLDPLRANYAQFRGAYAVLRLGVIVLLACLQCVVGLWVQGARPDVSRVVPIAVGGLLLLNGSVLGKVRPNWFFGIRTPWTLSSKQSWVKTHRMGGWILVLIGLALMLAGVVGPGASPLLTGVLPAAGAVWLIVYSYLVWRSDPRKVPAVGTRPGP